MLFVLLRELKFLFQLYMIYFFHSFMKIKITKLMSRFFLPYIFFLLSVSCFSQANYNVTDPEKALRKQSIFLSKEITALPIHC